MSITFDGVNKLAILSNGTTTLTVSEFWSRWVDWVALSDNSKYPVALSQIGGDEIGGGRYLGLTFFLENDWKIRPYEGDHILTISGNIYSRDGSTITAHTIDAYNVVVNLSTSNLVDSISTNGSTVSANDLADAVWDRIAVTNINSGSFGEMINVIKSLANATSVGVISANAKLSIANDLLTTLLKYERNRTKIDKIAKTLTVYDDDGLTTLKVFNLIDFSGSPSIEEIAERNPV